MMRWSIAEMRATRYTFDRVGQLFYKGVYKRLFLTLRISQVHKYSLEHSNCRCPWDGYITSPLLYFVPFNIGMKEVMTDSYNNHRRGFRVARSTILGNARALKRGTSR